MTSISNDEGGLNVRTKLNSSLAVTDAFTVSGGNVGIGATPTLKLDVRGGSIVAGAGNMVLYGRSASGFPSVAFNTGYFALGTNNTDAANGGLSIHTMAASTLTERMRIDSLGNVGVGTTSPNSASIIDAQSTTKGVRFPNMTTAQKTAIANVAGLVVFDTTLGKLCVNSGAGWQTITSV